jgi:hypothetical protein
LEYLITPKYCSRAADGFSRFRAVLPSVFEAGGSAVSDYVALQFRHGRYYCEHRAAHRRGGVQRLLVRNEVDLQRAEFLKREHELFYAPGKTVESPNHNYIE